MNLRRTSIKRRNPERLRKLRLLQFGTKARQLWWREQVCACGGSHPACAGEGTDPSHTRTRATGGLAVDIIPQSRGCHDFTHSKGWESWEKTTGVKRFELAHEWSLRGPDCPGPGFPVAVFSIERMETAMDEQSAKPKDVAELLGVAVGTIYRYQNGTSTPLLEHVWRLSKWSGFTVEELLGEAQP